MTLQIRLTGTIAISDGDHDLDERGLAGRQGRLVFARLALEGAPIHKAVLADVLWPDAPPPTWERTLSGILSRVRTALAIAGFDGLTIGGAFGNYELQGASPTLVDVHVAAANADAAVQALASGNISEATDRAEAAATTARRPFLAGEEGPWVDKARADLRSTLVGALESLAEALVGTPEAIAAAQEASEIEPYREGTHVLLMRAHTAIGNRADALRAYERCRALLSEELGVNPSAETQAAYLELLREESSVLRRPAARERLSNLPLPATSFVGRADTLAHLAGLLEQERVVTLTGPGGVGKTRLALEATRTCAESFKDGVFMVDLAGFTASSSIVEHVALALGLRAPPGATVAALAAVVNTQKLLMILDNCEHVLSLCASFVRELIDASSGPVVLATSREPLGLAGECAQEVSPLEVPRHSDELDEIAGSEAVALFCDRAYAARSGFELTASNAHAIAGICRHLDGVPLAIELAGARASAMSVAEIAERLSERFALLTDDAARVPRHRTLKTTIDWSYDALGSRAADAFRRCAVFEGAFTSEDAGAICERVVTDDLIDLASRSLISTIDDGRFHMLETIKEYGRERARTSDEWETALAQHLAYFAAVVPDLEASNDQGGFLAEFERIRPDARAALERALERGRLDEAIAIATASARFWVGRGFFVEGRDLLERTVAHAHAADRRTEIGRLLSGLGQIVHNQGDFAHAHELWERALEIATETGDEKGRAIAFADFASNAQATGRPEEAERCAELALDAARNSGADLAEGRALVMLALLGFNSKKDPDEVRDLGEQAFAAFEKAGNQSGMARALVAQAMSGWPDRAPSDWKDKLLRGVELSEQIGDSLTQAIMLMQLGNALAESGQFGEALIRLQNGLRINRRIGNHRGTLTCIEQIGFAAAEVGDAEHALMLITAAHAHQSGASMTSSESNPSRVESLIALAKRRAGQGADRALTEGRALSLDESYDLATGVSVQEPAAQD